MVLSFACGMVLLISMLVRVVSFTRRGSMRIYQA